MNFNTVEYPALHTSYPLHSRIRESIVRLFFVLCRGGRSCGGQSCGLGERENANDYRKIADMFEGLFRLCELGDANAFYLDLLTRITLFVRDFKKGKGERMLSYCLLTVWFAKGYAKFAQLFELFINKYGGWRDAVGLASFAHFEMGYSVDHPLILFCVDRMNAQLFKDVFAEGCHSPSERAFVEGCQGACASRTHLAFTGLTSNVAKWIPRENNKNGWMFPVLAEDWCRRWDMHKTHPSQKRKFYRKICSELNRQLGTFEVALCAGGVDFRTSMNFAHCLDRGTVSAPLGAFAKYSVKLSEVSQNVDANCCAPARASGFYYLDHGKFVSELARIAFFGRSLGTSQKLVGAVRVESIIRHAYRISGINSVWERDMERLTDARNTKKNLILVLDTGKSMFESGALYDAIGIICGLAKISSNGERGARVLTVGHLPSIVTLEKGAPFSNMVCDIFGGIGVGSSKNIERTFDLLVDSFAGSGLTEKEVEQLTVVYVSDMLPCERDGVDDDVGVECGGGASIHSRVLGCFHKKYHGTPHIVYWGVGLNASAPLPCECNSPAVSVVSSNSISCIPAFLKGLGDSSPHFSKLLDPFSNICYRTRGYKV